MKSKLLFLLLILPSLALAHPVDDPCGPGQDTEDGCQPVIAALGLDDPAFFAAHKAYWHSRRLLVTDAIIPYAICVGAVQELEYDLYGFSFTTGAPNIMDYWKVIPAHPELDFPGQVWRAEEQKIAADANISIIQYHVYLCNSYKSALRAALGR